MNRTHRTPAARVAFTGLAAAAILLASLALLACGGASGTSDAVPKSTPNIIPPTDTTAEKAAALTTSTSTTSTKSTGTSGEGSSSESSGGEGEEGGGEEASSGESASGAANEAAGGTSAGEKEKASGEGVKGTGEANHTGGANAPSGK
jgi:hypothetical protein